MVPMVDDVDIPFAKNLVFVEFGPITEAIQVDPTSDYRRWCGDAGVVYLCEMCRAVDFSLSMNSK